MGGPLNSLSEVSSVGGESLEVIGDVIEGFLLSSCEYLLTP